MVARRRARKKSTVGGLAGLAGHGLVEPGGRNLRWFICDLHGPVFVAVPARGNLAVNSGGAPLTGLVCPCYMDDGLMGTRGQVCGRILMILGPWWEWEPR